MQKYHSTQTTARGPSVRVLVVDDFVRFRQFVCSTLSEDPRLQVVGEAADGLEALQKAVDLQPDLIVIDLGLPNLNGIEVLRRIRTLCPQSKTLVASQESSADVVRLALNAGALGYVVKAQAASDLLVAVEAVLRGEQFVSNVVLMDATGQP
jgi:DNA-binding NarL/FixJ family response regulator